ncbi:hypothetical protein OAL23_01410 [bacterium]|nr:hypothetical protein [bacterium]
MFPGPDLHSYLERMESRIGFANTVQVEHPAELRIFEGLTPKEVSIAAAQHNLQVVQRVGGSQLEFTRFAKL